MPEAESAHTPTAVLDTELEALDGVHHLWCKACHPEWAARPLGAEVGVPFTAVCGQRAVLLARWQSDELAIPGVCAVCADPTTPCATCGSL
jgi:hypothetical protein